MKIVGVSTIVDADLKKFNEKLAKIIDSFQNENQEVEVQFSSDIDSGIKGTIAYSALILGRK